MAFLPRIRAEARDMIFSNELEKIRMGQSPVGKRNNLEPLQGSAVKPGGVGDGGKNSMAGRRWLTVLSRGPED